MTFLYKILGMLLQLLPKIKKVKLLDMEAKFFLPINNHYVIDDISDLNNGTREPKLYEWLNSIKDNSIYFDIGTSYGQEVSLLSGSKNKKIKVVGFDCSLATAHFCAINKKLNNDNFQFIFAAISDVTGKLTKIETSSDIHRLSSKRGVIKYSYDVMTLKLDDFCLEKGVYPTHLKIDIDGQEFEALKGAENILKRSELKEIFIEIENKNYQQVTKYIKSFGFKIIFEIKKIENTETIFLKS
tara:strand:- start:12 stop:737 length:726 start_codon:yes stop_codon:yes gene_type:complete